MKTKKVKDIIPITKSPKEIITKQELPMYIELPCLEACLYLYDINVHTFSSGCNNVNYDNAHIMLEWEYLSDENKEIAKTLVNEKKASLTNYNGVVYVTIMVNTTLNDDVLEVSRRLLSIAERFVYQDVLYGYKSKEQFIKEIIEFTHEFKYVDGEIIPIVPRLLTKEELEDQKTNLLFDANDALEDAIDEGRVDLENDQIFANIELLDKHISFMLNEKGLTKK